MSKETEQQPQNSTPAQQAEPQSTGGPSAKEYFKLSPLFGYFVRVFKKPDPNSKGNFNLRAMHTINKISIVMFLLALIVWIVRRLS